MPRVNGINIGLTIVDLATMNNDDQHYLINNEHLIVDESSKPIGKGSFGKVYAGTYFASPVAVKMFKPKTNKTELEKEAKILKYNSTCGFLLIFKVINTPKYCQLYGI